MYYALIGLLVAIVLVIINFDVFINKNRDGKVEQFEAYRMFLYGVLAYSITDSLWGVFDYFDLLPLLYTDTVIYFITVAIACLLWSKYVVTYLQRKSIWGKILVLTSNLFLLAEVVLIIINFFHPVLFYFDDAGQYHPSFGRHAILGAQTLMFIFTALYTLLTMKNRNEAKNRYKIIGLSGLLMALVLAVQMFFEMLPLYSIGYLLSICLLRTFVIEAEKEEYRRELVDALDRERQQKQELGSTRRLAYTDALTGIRNKLGYLEQEEKMVAKFTNGERLEFAVAVFDLNDLKETNDTLGHEKGDEYIVSACRKICVDFKHSPVFRIGGDEFVAVLEGEDYLNRERLTNEFVTEMKHNVIHGGVVVSMGLASFDRDIDNDYQSVFKRADEEMYRNKKELKDLVTNS